MNQYIKISYIPDWYFYPNHWIIKFVLDGKYHREKVPSWLNSYGSWNLFIQGKYQDSGFDFDWNQSIINWDKKPIKPHGKNSI